MADVALRPTFPAAELERLRAGAAHGAAAGARRSGRVSRRRHSRASCTATRTATARAPIGTTATLDGVHGRSSCARSTQRCIGRATRRLIVVGDVTPATVLPLLERAFGALDARRGRRASRRCPRRRSSRAREVTIVDMPGAEQSQIRIGAVGVARSTPDYFALQVLNTVLGGSFTSRLNQNLREEHGYAYGASSRFDMRLSPGPFAARRRRADRQDGGVVDGILQRARSDRGADRRGRAREGQELSGAGFPGRLRDDRAISPRVSRSSRSTVCRTATSRTTLPRSRAVTAADVQRAAAAHIRAGQARRRRRRRSTEIEPGIRALNLGPVRVVGVDEVVP